MGARQGTPVRINVGCGATPTKGWLNFDNSWTVYSARWRLLRPLAKLSLSGPSRMFFESVVQNDVRWARAQSLPCASASAEVVYTSHMLEHLARTDAIAFLKEVLRVLVPGGVVRIVVPDLERALETYEADGDADKFMAGTLLGQETQPRGMQRMLAVLMGPRHHQWMYDAASLSRLLLQVGFVEAASVPAGTTRIVSPGGLDLFERDEESIYVEAVRPLGL